MQTFVAPNGHTEWPPIAPGLEPESAPPSTSTSGDDSIESLGDALRTAQLRLAYFERFGPWVEEQMAAVVERAAEVERDTERARREAAGEIAALRAQVSEDVSAARSAAERERSEIAAELGRHRAELAALESECDQMREEAAATIAQAHKTAHHDSGSLSETATEIVQRALSELETLRAALTPEALAATSASLPQDEPELVAEPASRESEDAHHGWFKRK